jgi:alcohol dehydrogenase (NADP+)
MTCTDLGLIWIELLLLAYVKLSLTLYFSQCPLENSNHLLKKYQLSSLSKLRRTMGYPDTIEGYCTDGPKTWNKFHKAELKLKPFGDHDIDVEIAACGVCGSDVHTVTGGWGDYQGPLCVGHEVVGKAVRVGSHVKGIQKGDRVGVGAQVWACLECDLCKDANENYCPRLVDTYNAQYPDGSWAHGGFASHIRAHDYFTFKIPDELDTNVVAPLLCAGITTYSPLVRAGMGPGKRVGVVGIGGLGHIGLQ